MGCSFFIGRKPRLGKVFLHTESGFIGCSWGTCPCSPQFHALGCGCDPLWMHTPPVLSQPFWQGRSRSFLSPPKGRAGRSGAALWSGGFLFGEGKGHSLLATLSGRLSHWGSAVPWRGQPTTKWCRLTVYLQVSTCVPPGAHPHTLAGLRFQCIPLTVSCNIPRTGISDGLPCISSGVEHH